MRDLVKFNQFGTNPFRMLDDIEKDMKRFLDSFSPSTSDEGSSTLLPACDIEDKDSHYVMSFDVPGIPKENLDIEVVNGQLRISGERKSEKKEGDYSEKRYGRYERIMSLPEGVSEEDIEANYENGVLSVAVPKVESSRQDSGKKISISEGKKDGVWKKLLGGKISEKKEDKSEKNKGSKNKAA